MNTIIWGSGCQGVKDNCTGLGGINYIGPGPEILPRVRRANGLNLVDKIDLAVFRNDIAYVEKGASGVTGALFNLSVRQDDYQLVMSAALTVARGLKGENDIVTGKPISIRTMRLANAVYLLFREIVIMKYQLSGEKPPFLPPGLSSFP